MVIAYKLPLTTDKLLLLAATYFQQLAVALKSICKLDARFKPIFILLHLEKEQSYKTIIMANEINKKLAEEFRNTLDGDTWYSSNFITIINEVSADTAVKKLRGFPNSIAEIVFHMTQWKKFCIKKMEGDKDFDITLHSEEDWKRFNSLGEDEWEDIKSEFEEMTINLSKAISAAADEKLNTTVPGRKYSFFHLVIGIIEHETAHTTQISYLKRLLDN